MTARLIDITKLAGATVTRARGTEAYGNLRPMLGEAAIDLALDGAELLSSSFLDELVLRLREDGLADAVTFVTQNPGTLSKLARAAGLRGTAVFARSTPVGPRHRVSPQRPAFESIASATKQS